MDENGNLSPSKRVLCGLGKNCNSCHKVLRVSLNLYQLKKTGCWQWKYNMLNIRTSGIHIFLFLA